MNNRKIVVAQPQWDSEMSLNIRKATAADAQEIAALVKEFQGYLRALGDRTRFEFTAETYLRDGFGPNPAFSGLVAELDNKISGYLLYHLGYDTDRAMRLMYMIDLYVSQAKRRRGVGKSLMAEAKAICREAGSREIIWSVFIPNKLAFQFYESQGAKRIQGLESHVLAGSHPMIGSIGGISNILKRV